MASPVEFLIVGRTPLGGAVRAGLIGVVATMIGTVFFNGFWAQLGVGVVVVLVVLPLAYTLSKRDNPEPEAIAGPDTGIDRRAGPGRPDRPDGGEPGPR